MSRFLKQSTASQVRTIGPFLDDTDFKTAETALTVANTDIRLKKNGADDVAKNSGGATHDVNGCYHLTFDATDTDTVGELFYTVKVAGALQVFGSFTVLEEAVYDMLFGASALGYIANAPVNVAQISGDSTAADNAESFFDGTGYAGTGNTIPTVTTVTNQLTAAAIATGVWQDATAGDFTVASSIGKALYIANIAPGASGGHFISGSNAGTTTLGALTVTGAFTAGTNALPWNAAYDAEVQSEVEDAIIVHRLDELLNADSDIDGAAPPTVGSVFHELLTKTAGSFTYDQTTDSLEALRDRGDAAWTTSTLTANGIADAILDRDASTHTTNSTLGAIINDLEDGGRLDLLLDAAGSAGDPWTTTLPGAYGAGTAGFIIGTNLNATVSSRSSHSVADVWAFATRVLTAGTNIVLAKGVGVTGFNDLSAAQVNTEADTALADYDGPTNAEMIARTLAAASYATAAAQTTAQTSIDDLPTNAELATALGTADDAVLTQIALVKAKTDNLPSDPADESLIIAATDAIVALVNLIKAKTDQLAFGATNAVNANITHVNEIEVDGAGSEADPWGPA